MRRSVLRRVFSPLVGALLLLQAGVVPALESTDVGPRHLLESRHDASCLAGHDHSICTQAGANRSLGARPAAVAVAASTLPDRAPVGTTLSHAAAHVSGGRPRAPPTA